MVIIAQLSHKLSENIDIHSVGKFVFLFAIVLSAWMNGASYHDVHGNDDIRTRVFTFLQMGTVVGMAVFAHDAFGHGAVGFAISYALFLIIITFLWWRVGYHDREHSTISNPYSLAFLISTLLVIASIFVEAPLRFWLWAIAIGIITFLPLGIFIASTKSEKIGVQFEKARTLSPSLIERFGLMTIIVLGEVIIGVANGVASHKHLDFRIGIVAILSMTIAMGIWWLYFDFVSPFSAIQKRLTEGAWVYLHMSLTMGITAIGAVVLNVIKEPYVLNPNIRIALIAAVVIVYFSITLLFLTIEVPKSVKTYQRRGQIIMFITATVSILFFFLPVDAFTLLILLNIVMIVPIYYGIRVWIKEEKRRAEAEKTSSDS